VLVDQLLPAVPDRYRVLVALAGGTGLCSGECVGLRWDAVDLDGATVRVIRTVTEVAGHVLPKPCPKTRAGRRTVPLPPFVVAQLRGYRDAYPAGPSGEMFTNTAGGRCSAPGSGGRRWSGPGCSGR
jgi:integrase